MAAKAASTDSTQCGVKLSQSAAADPLCTMGNLARNIGGKLRKFGYWRQIKIPAGFSRHMILMASEN